MTSHKKEAIMDFVIIASCQHRSSRQSMGMTLGEHRPHFSAVQVAERILRSKCGKRSAWHVVHLPAFCVFTAARKHQSSHDPDIQKLVFCPVEAPGAKPLRLLMPGEKAMSSVGKDSPKSCKGFAPSHVNIPAASVLYDLLGISRQQTVLFS